MPRRNLIQIDGRSAARRLSRCRVLRRIEEQRAAAVLAKGGQQGRHFRLGPLVLLHEQDVPDENRSPACRRRLAGPRTAGPLPQCFDEAIDRSNLGVEQVKARLCWTWT